MYSEVWVLGNYYSTVFFNAVTLLHTLSVYYYSIYPASTDERDGLSASMEQGQHLLQDSKQRENELVGKVVALELQIQALSFAKEEVNTS